MTLSSLNSIHILPKKINKRIGRAMHDYAMLSHGDRVLVAVSGGVDSMVLSWLLQIWRQKAPIHYSLKAVYIENGFRQPDFGTPSPSQIIGASMHSCGIDFSSIAAKEIKHQKMTCFLCARNRRSQLFDLAKAWNCNKIALGHHQDDLIETLFINMLYSSNISTMVPKQELFDGEIAIIRPLAYLEKSEVQQLADLCSIVTVKNSCPLEKDTRRETVRNILQDIYAREPSAKKSLFRSLTNIRQDYML